MDNSSNNTFNTNDIGFEKHVTDEETGNIVGEFNIGLGNKQCEFLNSCINEGNAENFNKAVVYAAGVFRDQVVNANEQQENNSIIIANIKIFCGALLGEAEKKGINYKKDNAFGALYNYIVGFVFNNSENNNNFEFFSDNTNAISNESYENCGNSYEN